MQKKICFTLITIAAALILSAGCVVQDTSPKEKKKNIISIPGGTVSPVLGIGFDVNYDPSLDDVIPGYKVLTVAFTNNSMNVNQMDPLTDRWFIVDRTGSKKRAIINLREDDPDVWGKLPKRLKMLIEYPLLISAGSTLTIDLLFKNNINLGEFRTVIYQKRSTGEEFHIFPRED